MTRRARAGRHQHHQLRPCASIGGGCPTRAPRRRVQAGDQHTSDFHRSPGLHARVGPREDKRLAPARASGRGVAAFTMVQGCNRMKPIEGRCLCAGPLRATPADALLQPTATAAGAAKRTAPLSYRGSAGEERFRLRDAEDCCAGTVHRAEPSRFCSRCGTTRFFASTLCPGEIHVTRASIRRDDRAPQLHCFYDQHVDWASVGDELRVRHRAEGSRSTA